VPATRSTPAAAAAARPRPPGQRAQPLLGPGHMDSSRWRKLPQHPVDVGRVESAPCRIARCSGSSRPGDGDERQRVVVLLQRAHVAHLQRGQRRGERGIHRVVLEDHQAVEERSARGHSLQRCTFTSGECSCWRSSAARLEPLEPRHERLIRRERTRTGSVLMKRPTMPSTPAAPAGGPDRWCRRRRRPVPAWCRAGAPRPLQHGVEREPVLAHEALSASVEAVDRGELPGVARPGPRRPGARGRPPQLGGLGETPRATAARSARPPPGPRSWSTRCSRGRAAPAPRAAGGPGEALVEDEDPPDEEGNGPAVQQDVVVAEDEAVRRVPGAQQRERSSGGVAELDARRRSSSSQEVKRASCSEPESRASPPGAAAAPPRGAPPGGLVDVLPDDGRAEDGERLHRQPPGLREGAGCREPAARRRAGEVQPVPPAPPGRGRASLLQGESGYRSRCCRSWSSCRNGRTACRAGLLDLRQRKSEGVWPPASGDWQCSDQLAQPLQEVRRELLDVSSGWSVSPYVHVIWSCRPTTPPITSSRWACGAGGHAGAPALGASASIPLRPAHRPAGRGS
jgi:hypothetical protein